ncbi:rhomboid-related protein 2 isoform X2 [Daktulosphaira vitifoliae]|uniref:rhomboid-related protein 2 isoform X2 n=1 Tax=Daktulosphaira vitifoliae TaxID=58002 RepID=UPI0021AA727A|nr:rhomboid-related protein 2 isoform X2 [Daktulosphaira vitifoliae]
MTSLNFQSIPLNSVESQWETLYNQFDKNRDGKISISELYKSLKEGVGDQYNIPSKCLKSIALAVDRDQNEYISFREFLNFMENHPVAKSLTSSVLNKYIHYAIVPRGPPRLRSVGLDHTDGDYEDEYSCNPPALCMILVSLIEIFIFTWDVLKLHTTESIRGPMASTFIFNPHRRHEAWRFLTYMFVHVGQTHLIVNLIVQVLLGIPLEMVHRGWRVVLIYLSGVLAGSLATSVSDPSVYLAGASGGVYALITAHVATIIINWSEMEFGIYQLLVFSVLIVFDTGSSIYNRYFVEVDNQIGYTAHLAGAIAGLLVGVYTLRNLNVKPWEKKLSWIFFTVYIILIGSAVLCNIVLSDYFSKEKY